METEKASDDTHLRSGRESEMCMQSGKINPSGRKSYITKVCVRRKTNPETLIPRCLETFIFKQLITQSYVLFTSDGYKHMLPIIFVYKLILCHMCDSQSTLYGPKKAGGRIRKKNDIELDPGK